MPGKRSRFLLLILLFYHTLLWPLEVKEGRIKLILHEEIGRFSLYTLSEAGGEDYIPLFVAQDPRTSGISLVVENKIVKLGDSSEYQETAGKTDSGARFVWSSNKLKIVQDFVLLQDGVKITLTLTNVSDRELEAGIKFCLDTYLGEEGFPHFKTDRDPEINRELSIERKNMIQYWVSPKAENSNIGLQCITSGRGITMPDRIVFANWKRLQDASWLYKTSGLRDFSLMPYSINDSAVCHYYNPKILRQGRDRTIVTVLGNLSLKKFEMDSRDELKLDNLLEEALGQADESDSLSSSLVTDLGMINKLLDELNKKISSGEVITDEELRLIRDILTELNTRSKKYSEGM